jgi:hypothetical protein
MVLFEEVIMRKWIWAALVAAPLAAAGGFGLVYANSQAQSYTCPLTGEQLPCPKCCPLNESKQQAQEQTFTCPVTGEELPCEKCCPLNEGK